MTGVPGFPRDGNTFLVLSTGDATLGDQADQPGAFPSVDDKGGPDRTRGDTALDDTVIQTGFNVPLSPAGAPLATCLSFDVRFLSEEYPDRIASVFTDAFVAELDTSPWTTSGPTISATNNFASSPFGRPLTIKSGGPAAMSPAQAAGTPYGAATPVMRAQVLVPATTSTRVLFLSLFDHGDRTYDSAAFIDNLRLTTPPGTCTTGLISLGPAVAITGPTVAATVNTATPTLTGTAGNAAGDAPTVAVRIYNGARPGRCPRAVLVGAARRQHLVGSGGSTRAGPVHGAGHAGERAGRRRQRAHYVHRPARRAGEGARPAAARAASRAPATATTTASPTTRTPPTARCRRSPERPSTRAWSRATSSSSTRRAPGRGRR